MKDEKNISLWAKIVGIVVTLLMLLLFGTKLIGSIVEKGFSELLEIPKAFVTWHDNPIGFFFTYLIGYTIIWWKPLWGSVIILIGGLLFLAFNLQNTAVLIFILPTYLVAMLYLLYWDEKRK